MALFSNRIRSIHTLKWGLKGRRGEYIQTLDWLKHLLAEIEIGAFEYSLF
ncbi:hypothetical protein J26TS2_32270 [Shouchella clausii]|nr:hypothetical protein J26TS2_32270 [Shouchella clausii]